MFKSGNKFLQPEKYDYQKMINVWVDDKKRIDVIKRLMIEDKTTNLQKIKTNPVYKEVANSLILENDKLLEKYDKSWLWSRKLTPQKFKSFSIPIFFYVLIVVPYIIYKVIPKRILEFHIKYDYDGEYLKPYYDIDFKNKDLYSDKMIEMYFETKKKKDFVQEEKHKAIVYSDKFVENISRGYMSDFYKRRRLFGFEDEE